MNNYIYEGYGIILPSSVDQKQGWYYVKVDDSISSYYKWFYSKAFKQWYPCMNGCHITFIAGEKDDRIIQLEEMKDYIEKEIHFIYDNTIYTNGRAFWINCTSKDLDEIRNKLGLRKRDNYHITLGNIKNVR